MNRYESAFDQEGPSQTASETEWEKMAREANAEREQRETASSEELHFSPIGEDEMQTIAGLERKLYSQDTLQYQDQVYLEELMREPGSEDYSFIIDDDKKEPIGFCIAYEAEPMSEPDYDGKTVYIADFGIVPEARNGLQTAMKSFDELMRRVEEKGVGLVEMEARKDTSYRLLANSFVKRLIAKRGFEVTDHGVSDDGWSDGDVTYLVSLRKMEQQ